MSDLNQNLWGIDLGGTKMEGAVLKSAENPEVICRLRIPTEASKGYDHVLGQVHRLVMQLAGEVGHRPETIGMGTPGTAVPATGLIKNSNAVCLNGKPLARDLNRLLNSEVTLANDANCFALAETHLGIVRQKYPQARVVFGVILGTGVGGGLVVNGQLINGHHGIGGEWGHAYLSGFSGRKCFCGKEGDNESVFSGPSLEWYYEQLTGQQRRLPDILRRARLGQDTAAQQTLDRLTRAFAQAISVVINVVDPDVIVIGGGLSKVDELFSDGVAAIERHVFNREFTAPVVRPLLGDSAGVFGAALLPRRTTQASGPAHAPVHPQPVSPS